MRAIEFLLCLSQLQGLYVLVMGIDYLVPSIQIQLLDAGH
jgi:hypothetical protein